MKKVIISVAMIIGLVVVLMSSTASAGISVAGDDWTGSRSSAPGGGVTATGNWGEEFVIRWNITQDGGSGLYTYQYTINKPPGGADALSHWIFEVTDPSSICDFSDFDPDVVEGPNYYTSANGNPYMPSSGVYGIKFNTQGTTFSFSTLKDPVWGDFYAKDGASGGPGSVFNVAYNVNFGTNPTLATNNFNGWIPTPNGGTPPPNTIPEPASMLLLGSGLLGFAGLKRKKK